MNTASYPDYLDIEVDQGVATVTFSKVDHENRYTAEENAAYDRFMADAMADPEIRVVIQTGAGSEWYSAGMMRGMPGSLEYLAGGADEAVRSASVRGAALHGNQLRTILERPKPVITALNGDVIGMPLTHVLASDFVIADRHARLRDTHTGAGMASATGPMLWPLSTGIMAARRWILTGDWMEMDEAMRLGLVSEVVDSGGCVPRAREIADQLKVMRPDTLALTKRNLNAWLVDGLSSVFAPAFIAAMAMMPSAEDHDS